MKITIRHIHAEKKFIIHKKKKGWKPSKKEGLLEINSC